MDCGDDSVDMRGGVVCKGRVGRGLVGGIKFVVVGGEMVGLVVG